MLYGAFYSIIPILPILVLVVSMVLILINISIFSNVFFSYIISITGFLISLITLFFIKFIDIKDIINYFLLDKYSILSILVILVSGLYASYYSYYFFLEDFANKNEIFLLILLSSIGGSCLSITNNIMVFFVGIELLFLPMLGFVCFLNKNKNLIITFKYMMLSIFSSLIFLLGSMLVYSVTGTLFFLKIQKFFLYNTFLLHREIVFSGIILIILSLFFKLSIIPFHFWMPNIYSIIPSSFLIYFNTAIKFSVFFLMIRFFPVLLFFQEINIFWNIIKFFSIVSIILGNFIAIFQKNIKNLISYTSITNFGILLSMFFLNKNNDIFSSLCIYVIGYLLNSILLFCLLSILSKEIYNEEINILKNKGLKGLFWIKPYLCISLSICLFSFLGFPVTLGFWGKFYIIKNAIFQKEWVIIFSVLCSSIFGLFCYLPIIFDIYEFTENKIFFNRKDTFDKYWISTILISIINFSLVFFGFFPQLLINLTKLYL